MANIALFKEELNNFSFCFFTYNGTSWRFLEEHVISQEVHMLTQRKMFTKHKLLQTTHLVIDNVNKDVTC